MQDFCFHVSFVMHQDWVNNKKKEQTTANQDIHKSHDKRSGTCYAAICHSVNALLLRREQGFVIVLAEWENQTSLTWCEMQWCIEFVRQQFLDQDRQHKFNDEALLT